METAKQFSVYLANKPGRLSTVLTGLQKEKVHIRAFSVMDSGSRARLRFVPNDPELTSRALESINVKFDICDVLLVTVSHQSGGLPKVCQRLASEHLNIDYAYGSHDSPVRSKGGSVAIVKVNDLTKAQRVLEIAVPVNGYRPTKRPGRRPAHAR